MEYTPLLLAILAVIVAFITGYGVGLDKAADTREVVDWHKVRHGDIVPADALIKNRFGD